MSKGDWRASTPPPHVVEAKVGGLEIWIEREKRAGTGAFVLWVLDADAEQSVVEAEKHDSLDSAKAAAERVVDRALSWTKGQAWHLRH